MSESAQRPAPWLRVVRGDPGPEELAALVLALRVVATRRPSGVSTPSGWVRNSRPDVTAAGLPTERGPGVWRAVALPR